MRCQSYQVGYITFQVQAILATHGKCAAIDDFLVVFRQLHDMVINNVGILSMNHEAYPSASDNCSREKLVASW